MTEQAIRVAQESGAMPLDYLLGVMRDEGQPPGVRMDAAKAALPYLHPRLSAVELKVPGELPVAVASKAQRDAAVAAYLRADS